MSLYLNLVYDFDVSKHTPKMYISEYWLLEKKTTINIPIPDSCTAKTLEQLNNDIIHRTYNDLEPFSLEYNSKLEVISFILINYFYK